mgnify:CR=1 FL=1
MGQISEGSFTNLEYFLSSQHLLAGILKCLSDLASHVKLFFMSLYFLFSAKNYTDFFLREKSYNTGNHCCCRSFSIQQYESYILLNDWICTHFLF